MPAAPVAVAQPFTPPTDEATVETVDSVQDEQPPVPAPMEAPQPQEAAPNGAPNVLELDTTRVFNEQQQHSGADPRDLGILLKWLSWGAP